MIDKATGGDTGGGIFILAINLFNTLVPLMGASKSEFDA
jgi:hypothetical protein